MTSSYRKRLFEAYAQTHASFLESDERSKLIWSQAYVERNYLRHLAGFDRASANLLEIGCGKGYFLKAFQACGFQHLSGVDLSPEDVAAAQRIMPGVAVLCQDAHPYLLAHPGQFDIIALKAVLEHIPKEMTLPMLAALCDGLKPGGLVIIDVPNMDWLFASHERYMDFTHEAGFTRESLRQVMNNYFQAVSISPVDHLMGLRKVDAVKRRLGRWALETLLTWADPQGASTWLWARSLVGTGRKE